MRRHVIRPFSGMRECGVAVGHQRSHVTLQVRANIRVRILAQNERGTGVVEKDIANTGPDTGPVDTFLDLPGNRAGATSAGRHKKFILENHYKSLLPHQHRTVMPD